VSEEKHLSGALEGMFANPQNGWFSPFTEAVAGLTAAEASWVPGPDMNSIWALVNHVRFWHELVLRRLRGEHVDRLELGSEKGWPPSGSPDDEQAWQESCARAISANRDLSALVRELTAAEVDAPVEEGRARRWQVLHGLIGHTCYHTGQIILLRRLQGNWRRTAR
jgi:uncharacterized damage-inducible protein DinB